MTEQQRVRRDALRYLTAHLSDQSFRSRLHPRVRIGEATIVAAHPDDPLSHVLGEVEDAGGAANVVAHTALGYAIVWIETAADPAAALPADALTCASTASFEMHCTTLVRAGHGPVPSVRIGVATGELISV